MVHPLSSGLVYEIVACDNPPRPKGASYEECTC